MLPQTGVLFKSDGMSKSNNNPQMVPYNPYTRWLSDTAALRANLRCATMIVKAGRNYTWNG